MSVCGYLRISLAVHGQEIMAVSVFRRKEKHYLRFRKNKIWRFADCTTLYINRLSFTCLKSVVAGFLTSQFLDHIVYRRKMTAVSASPSSPTHSFEPTEKEECPYLLGAVWRETYMARDTFINLIAVACITLLSVLPTILLNALVILAVAAKRRLQTNSNILLACLAGTDLLTGLVVYPVAIAVDMKRIFGAGPFCTLEKLFLVALVMVGFASLSHLVLISVDRYIAVKYPLRYENIVTKQRIKIGVVLVWAITVLTTIQESFPAFILDDEAKTYSVYMTVNSLIYVVIFSVYTGAIAYTYCYILSETRRQKKRIETEQLTQEEAKRVKKDNKAANTLTMILCALIVTYLPLTIDGVVTALDMIEPRVESIVLSWCTTFIMLASFFNPVIYCWRIKKLRRAFLEFLPFRQLENRPQDFEMIEIQRHRTEIQRIQPRKVVKLSLYP